MSKPTAFNSLAEAIGAASYVEQLLNAESQWINNRLSWLFISQSFCITAYTILSTSTADRFAGGGAIQALEFGLPLFGMICSVMVGVAVIAATRVAGSLVRERRRLVRYINENSHATIPLVGAEGDLRKARWINWAGGLPHRALPWVLALFWLLQVIW
jgi:hypothetical protein